MISRLAGVCLLLIGIGFLIPVIFGNGVLAGPLVCIIPGAIIVGGILVAL